MRVILLTHYYPPEVGAPQARISGLAEGLAGAGVEVTVHTCPPHYPDGEVKPPYRNRPLERTRQGKVGIVRSAVYPAPNRGFGRRIANHASFATSALASAPFVGSADVLVVETPPLFLARAAVAYSRLKRARLIVNVADLWPDSAIELGSLSSPGAIRVARAMERTCYRRAAAITCPTRGIAAALERHPDAAGKARRIAPTVDLDRFRVAPASAEGAFRVLYAGTIGMAHGVGTLVSSGRLLASSGGADVEVQIAGDGAEAEPLRAEIAARGPSNVAMLGAVPTESVPELYAQAHASVVLLRDKPLFSGALPTKMLEAMAAARPVVLSAPTGEASELIESAGAGVVVPPEDPAALAEALTALAADRVRASALGAAGKAWVEAHHGRSRSVEQWLDLLREVVPAGQ